MIRNQDSTPESVNLNYVGHVSTLHLSGFGFRQGHYNTDYELDQSNLKERVYENKHGSICFDQVESCWLLRAINSGMLVCRQLQARAGSPEGVWEGGCRVTKVVDRPSLVAQLAFPAPTLDLDFYSTNGFGPVPLLRHSGLAMLTVDNFGGGGRGSCQVPSVMLRFPSAVFTILYSHGNGEDLGIILDDLIEFGRTVKANVFAYDYLGYSTSKLEGRAPSEKGCYAAAGAAWAHLTGPLGVEPRRVVLFGRSIGSGPTCDLASRPCCRESVAGVVLQSPIASGSSVLLGQGYGSAMARPFDIFTNYSKLPAVRVPVAILHGIEDEVVAVENGRRLFGLCACAYKPLWIDHVGHNDVPLELRNEYTIGFLRFLEGQLAVDHPAVERGKSQLKASEECAIC